MANLPRDNGVPVQGVPPNTIPLARTYDATISASTEIVLNAATALIEVAAIDKAVALRWGAADVSLTDFDAIIPANTVRRFYIPKDVTAVNLIELAATGIVAVTEYA